MLDSGRHDVVIVDADEGVGGEGGEGWRRQHVEGEKTKVKSLDKERFRRLETGQATNKSRSRESKTAKGGEVCVRDCVKDGQVEEELVGG